MNPDFDLRTSKSLLEKLRVFENERAWSQFVQLYLPMIQSWGRRYGLSPADGEELTSRIVAKLVEALPRFEYDPQKGSFRGWLKTVTMREVTTFARERRRKTGVQGAGGTAAYDLMQEQAVEVDNLVDDLHSQSEELLENLQRAVRDLEADCKPEERISWELFRRIFLGGESIEACAAKFDLTYHAAAMRVQRIKKKVRDRAVALANN